MQRTYTITQETYERMRLHLDGEPRPWNITLIFDMLVDDADENGNDTFGVQWRMGGLDDRADNCTDETTVYRYFNASDLRAIADLCGRAADRLDAIKDEMASTVETCWSCGSTAKTIDQNEQAWCDDCGQPWDKSQSAEHAPCDWCGGTGVTKVESEGPNDHGGAVPCSHCRCETGRTTPNPPRREEAK